MEIDQKIGAEIQGSEPPEMTIVAAVHQIALRRMDLNRPRALAPDGVFTA